MTSPDSGIHLIFSPENTNTFKKLESEYIFVIYNGIQESIICVNPFSCLESIYDHEYENISFLALEYEYIYPLREVNMGPVATERGDGSHPKSQEG